MWMLLYVPLFLILGVLILMTAIVSWSNTKWKKRGFSVVPITYYWRRFLNIIFLKISKEDTTTEVYRQLSGKKLGAFVSLFGSGLWVRDPDLIRDILVKDFNHFVDRQVFDFGKNNEISNSMIFILRGHTWKDVRQVLSPTFTSGKMKRIFSSVSQCGQKLMDYFNLKAQKEEEFEMKDAFGRYTLDVIATTAFGVQCDVFQEPPTLFPAMVKKLSNTQSIVSIILFFVATFTRFVSFLRMLHINIPNNAKDALDFFAGVVKESIAKREESGVKSNDFLQLLMEARKGELQEDTESDNLIGYKAASDKTSTDERKNLTKAILTENLLIAQCVAFLLAGFDTTSVSLVYELAVNPDIQERLYEEVVEVTERYNGQITYDSIMEMDLLDKVMHETLRLHPPAPKLTRTCTKEYKIPGTNQVIEKGTLLIVPNFAIHRDERYYPNPDKFDPDRFSHEEKSKRHPYVYLPFGHGPRNCIGMRLALMETKAVLAYTVLHFHLRPSAKTDIPMQHVDNIVALYPKNGVWLKVEKRK